MDRTVLTVWSGYILFRKRPIPEIRTQPMKVFGLAFKKSGERNIPFPAKKILTLILLSPAHYSKYAYRID